MSSPILYLSKIPAEAEFYQKFWNKRPFVIKAGIGSDVMEKLIKADELAGLSLEEEIRSRIVFSENWSCQHGPFDENIFNTIGEKNWSLLVQDVEKFHPPTGDIIKPFGFSPCWLIDDVMVSYSVPGGGVGPHLDSYHVFLIQGDGKRRWKIGREAILSEKYIEDIDLKILANEFAGDEFEVEQGDIIYIPPFFPHSGETILESLTFSIGFLGPSIAELLVEYGQYIEEQDDINKRYAGDKLDSSSSGNEMSGSEVDNFRNTLIGSIKSDHFENWLRDYFKANKD